MSRFFAYVLGSPRLDHGQDFSLQICGLRTITKSAMAIEAEIKHKDWCAAPK